MIFFDPKLHKAFEDFEKSQEKLDKLLNFPKVKFNYEIAHLWLLHGFYTDPDMFKEEDLKYIEAMEKWSQVRGGPNPWKLFKDTDKVRVQRIIMRYYDKLKAIAPSS